MTDMSARSSTIPSRVLTMVSRHVGGVAVFWDNLRRQFDGIDVVYFTPDHSTFFDTSTRTLHFNVYDPRAHIYATLARHVSPDDYDVLVANERFELEFFVWSRARRPIVFIVHTNHEHSYSVAFAHANHVDHFFCVSETANAYLKARGIERISPFLYSTFIDAAPALEKRRRVIYVGRLEPDKNILETLELFSIFKRHNYEVRMIGVGSMEAEVRAALEPHEAKIGISRAEVLREMAEARFLCLNSYVEGLPIIFSEAMHFKMGVICNYIDKSAHRVLGANHLLHSTPEALLRHMESFVFESAPEPRRINNPALNETFLQQLNAVRTHDRERPVFKPGGVLDNLPWIPSRIIRAFRAWKMNRVRRA